MAHNPLLGSRISLISKKNIRYEGTLYSINEADATVALQNVRAFGTEGREMEENAAGETGSGAFVAPQDQVHPYLLFRGCDIKDLHVHEQSSTDTDTNTNTNTSTPPAAAAAAEDKSQTSDTGVKDTSGAAEEAAVSPNTSPQKKDADASEAVSAGNRPEPKPSMTSKAGATAASDDKKEQTVQENVNTKETNYSTVTADGASGGNATATATSVSTSSHSTSNNNTHNNNNTKPKSNNRRNRNRNPNHRNSSKQMVGSGASLLHRKARGVVNDAEGRNEDMKKDFDFESNLAEFSKTSPESESDGGDDVEDGDDPSPSGDGGGASSSAYTKDDFFDSISNDVMDRASGMDHRIRGREERNLNTETFGATSLGNSRRYRRRGGRGGGSGGGNHHQGNRRNGGGGRGRGHRGGRGRGGRGGRGRQYGDGGLAASSGNQAQPAW